MELFPLVIINKTKNNITASSHANPPIVGSKASHINAHIPKIINPPTVQAINENIAPNCLI